MDTCTIQLFAYGAWHDAGDVSLFGKPEEGWRARTYSGYALEWAAEHMGTRDAHAFACEFPVAFEPYDKPTWPVFLIDLLPQGFGRGELLRRLQLPETAAASADWPLLLAGAGNTIGHLRVKQAADWLAERASEARGFTDAEIAQRAEDFTEYLAQHGLFVAGSSGVQGEWPKLLMTRGDDGLLYLDHTLPDARACEHFIVKFGRGADPHLAQILRHEAPYMAAAAHLGLNVFAPLTLRDRVLFIPRFDRRVTADGVVRLAQESVATLTGTPGFGATPTHDAICLQLIRRCTDPQAEVLEYIRRDVANLALGNKDNHARNTAVQRDFDGRIALTPLFDFAPMYLHPDGIARRIRWDGNDNGRPDWSRVLDAVCLAAEADPETRDKALSREELVEGLRAMAPQLATVLKMGAEVGMEPDVVEHVRAAVSRLVGELENLR